MRNFIAHTLISSFLPVCLTMATILSCSKDNVQKSSLNFDVRTEDCLFAETKANTSHISDYTTLPSSDDFTATIFTSDGKTLWSGLLKEWKKAEITLPSGDYSVEAVYGKKEAEGKDSLYLAGSSKFHIETEGVLTVPVTDTLANCIVKTGFSDAFKKYFTEYKISVKTASGKVFQFPSAEYSAVFIEPIKMTVEGTLKNQGGGEQTFAPVEYASLKAKTCYTLFFDASQTGVVKATITFDDTVETIDLGEIELN